VREALTARFFTGQSIRQDRYGIPEAWVRLGEGLRYYPLIAYFFEIVVKNVALKRAEILLVFILTVVEPGGVGLMFGRGTVIRSPFVTMVNSTR
jgi:hypothetical protein